MVEKTSIEAQFRISNKRNNYVRMPGTYKRDEREKHINENRVDQEIVENLLPGSHLIRVSGNFEYC